MHAKKGDVMIGADAYSDCIKGLTEHRAQRREFWIATLHSLQCATSCKYTCIAGNWNLSNSFMDYNNEMTSVAGRRDL